MTRLASDKGVGTTSLGIDTSLATTLIVGMSYEGADNAPTDSKGGNTWLPLTAAATNGITVARVRLWICSGANLVNKGAGHTFTVPLGYGFIAVEAHDGSWADAGITSSGNNNTPPMTECACGTVTTIEDGSLVFAFNSGANSLSDFSINSPLSISQASPGVASVSFGGVMASGVQTTAGAVSPLFQWTGSGSAVGVAAVLAPAPTPAPDLSAPVATATGATTATASFNTDTPSLGNAYFLVLPAGDSAPADGATLIANGGTLNQVTSGSTTQTRNLTGLTAGVAIRVHMTQTGTTEVVSSASITPSTLAYSGTIAAQTGVQGSAFVFSGANPSTLFSGGIGTTSFALGTGSLTGSGLTINSTTGLPTGTCGTPGTYTLTVRGTDQSTVPQTVDSNSFNIVISASAPSISAQPANQTVTAPNQATFSVTASGAGLSYQWARQPSGGGGFSNISGATNASYTTLATSVTGGVANNGDQYRVTVTNSGGSITSTSATLTVNAAADVTPPTQTGSLVASLIGTTFYTLTWPAGADNVAVTGYEYSLDGGSNWINAGNVLTASITGRTPLTTDQCRVRCYDAAGNRSTPALSTTVNLLVTTVTTEPLENFSGSLLLGLTVKYSWFPGGRIGALTGITPLEGTTISDGTTGVVTINGLPLGAGVLLTCYWGATPDLDAVHYHALTVV